MHNEVVSGPIAPLLLLVGSVASLALAGVAVGGILRVGGRAADVGLGAATWAVTVAIKIGLALAILRPLSRAFQGRVPLGVEIASTGLLTGLTECLLALPLVLVTARRWKTFESGMAFGIGFGAAEATVLAVPLLMVGLVGLVIPSVLSGQDMAEVRAMLDDRWRGLEFAAERLFAGSVHILAGVLIVESVRRGRVSYFLGAFVLKSAMDAIPTNRGFPRWGVESAYALMAVVSLVVVVWMWRSHRRGGSGSGESEFGG